MTQSDLAQLWVQAGGPPAAAPTMAAIAMAESGGSTGAQNPSGAAGLWQILPSAHPQFNVHQLLTDPAYNARAAVSVYNSQGLGAWSTYTNGAFKQYLSGAAAAGATDAATATSADAAQGCAGISLALVALASLLVQLVRRG